MRTTIPKISLRDDHPAPRVVDEAPPSGRASIPVIELDSSELEDRVSDLPGGLHDGITTSARQGAIAGPMGPVVTSAGQGDDRR